MVIDGYPKKYGYGYALSELNHLDNSSYYKYALQQNIYKYILEHNYQMPISSMNLIVLHENFDRFYRVNLENMQKDKLQMTVKEGIKIDYLNSIKYRKV